MFDNKSLFGKDFKFILSLTALVWMTYTLPQVQASLLSSGEPLDIATAQSNTQVAQVYASPSPTPCAGSSATIALDPSSPLTQTLAQDASPTGTKIGLPVMVFDMSAYNIAQHIKMMTVRANTTGTGQITAAYIYSGTTMLASASVVQNAATFYLSQINIPSGTKMPLTVVYDIGYMSSSTPFTVSASLASTDVWVQDSNGNTVTLSGSAQGNTQTIVKAGPQFSLVGAPTITKQVIATDPSGNSTTTYTASFVVQATSVGTQFYMGLPSSSLAAWTVGQTSFSVYKNGAPVSLVPTAVTYSQPANTTISADGTYFQVALQQTVSIPVTVSFTVPNSGANVYAVQMQGIRWMLGTAGGSTLTNFMQNQPAWRTSSI